MFKTIRKALKAKEFVKKLENKTKKPQVLFLGGGPGSGKKT